MSTAEFDRARQAEMRRIRSSRPRYGYDSPRRRAARTRPADAVNWRQVGKRAITIVALYCLVAGLGLLGMSLREATVGPRELTRPATGQPHGAYRLTPVSPRPARTAGGRRGR